MTMMCISNRFLYIYFTLKSFLKRDVWVCLQFYFFAAIKTPIGNFLCLDYCAILSYEAAFQRNLSFQTSHSMILCKDQNIKVKDQSTFLANSNCEYAYGSMCMCSFSWTCVSVCFRCQQTGSERRCGPAVSPAVCLNPVLWWGRTPPREASSTPTWSPRTTSRRSLTTSYLP